MRAHLLEPPRQDPADWPKIISPHSAGAMTGEQFDALRAKGFMPAIAGGAGDEVSAVYQPADAVDHAHWGGHNVILEAWWRDVLDEAGKSNRLLESERLMEAETKIDFENWLYGYVGASFFKAYRRYITNWRLYAGKKSLRDFREHRIKGRNRLRGFGYVGDHAHRPGMRRSYRPEASLFIDTYGAHHDITRQAIINQLTDEILRDDPAEMGREAANYLAEALVALIESNPTAPDGNAFYSTAGGGGRGNLTTSEVSGATLLAAYTAFQTRRYDGEPIGVTPRRILVQNRTTASIIYRDITSQQGTAATNDPANSAVVRGNGNPVAALPWPDDFVVEEPRLHDFNDAYMIADPEEHPAWLVGLLEGAEEPQLFQNAPQRRAIGGGMTNPYMLRVQNITFEVDWDIGVSAVNPDVVYAWRPA